jgi:type II secretion system protein H
MLRNNRGFNLVELMVVIGVFGLLVAIGIPGFSRYLRTNQLSTSASRLAADLQLARSTSIASGRVIRVAASGTGYTLTDLSTGNVIANRQFEGGCTLAADVSVRFFPWGVAETGSFNVANCSGAQRTITLLPTGVVEVD